MKIKHIFVLIFQGLFTLAKAEVNPVSISTPYTVHGSSGYIEVFAKGYAAINYNYNYDYYDEWGMLANQKPTEINLYDSTFRVVKKIKLAKINRWNQRVEISKDGKNIFVMYQPVRWNRSVAGGTVKLCVLDKNLTCTRICKFIIPGSRPSIQKIQKISTSHIVVDGNFVNRGNHFLLNVNMNTGKFTSFKLPKRQDVYFIKHYVQDDKTIVLSKPYEMSNDSLRLSIFTNTGTLLKRQWIVMNEGYPLQDIDMIRIGKNKYAFYGQGYNRDLGTGHENYLAVLVYENGKITKKVIVNGSMMDFAARNDFSKLGLTTARENSRKEFEANRKVIKDYYPPTLNNVQLLSANDNFYLFASIYHSEVQGGVLVQFDENFSVQKTTVFPVAERQTIRLNAYVYANGKGFANGNGFYYAYSIENDVSGIFVDKSGSVNSFAFETDGRSTPSILIMDDKGFLVCNKRDNPGAEPGYEYEHEFRKILAE